jgi:hypothetical protein
MYDNCGCYSVSDLEACDFMQSGGDVTLRSIVNSSIRLKDKYWFVCRKLATIDENKAIAIRVAEIVLPIYEKRFPDNKAPREAIAAAGQYNRGEISRSELISRRKNAAAADAAAAAADAYAAAAAAADAYAAYAAAAAAAAAAADAAAADAYAAAATAAAYAYAAAAAAAAAKRELQEYLESFVTN